MKRRLPAEWETQSAIQFTFPHAGTDWADLLDEVTPCFVEIIETVSRYQKALIICADERKTRFLLRHAVQDNLLFTEADSNDTWARDHGGITVFEDGEPVIIDFVFNGWGLKFPANKDNLITGLLYDRGFLHAKRLERPGIVLEGGAIDTDGQGTLLTTAECLRSPNRNPWLTKAETEERLQELFGLERILWLHHGYLAGDDTDSHVDTLARFCDPRTIAYVQCRNPQDEHYEALQAMEAELRSFRTGAGFPYRLIPLPLPSPVFDDDGQRLPATYANFLIINGAVLLPLYEVPEDTEAIRIMQNIFTDHEVIGINCRPLIRQHGSLHCITMNYPQGVVR